MTDKISISRETIKPIDERPSQTQRVKKETKISFRDILADELARKGGLKFSAHARERLQARDIRLTESELNRFYTGVDKVARKGARESLILVNDVAFVVSIKNRTVITAVDGKNLKENVFTNIDSAVIM